MGPQGTGKGVQGDVVLDAGALIAFERGNDEVRAILRTSLALGFRLIVPASVLAQAWRGGPRSAHLTRLLDAGEVDPLDEQRAREVGVRLGLRQASDLADAHVVCCAVEHRAMIATSDEDDIRGLAGPRERLTVIPV
jgi:predicted nucleic acid-binding protein